MTTQTKTTKHSHRTNSPSNTLRTVESHKLLPTIIAMLVFNTLLAGLSLGLACWSLSWADKARMEARIEQVKTEGFYRALIAAKIDPNPHVKGENP